MTDKWKKITDNTFAMSTTGGVIVKITATAGCESQALTFVPMANIKEHYQNGRSTVEPNRVDTSDWGELIDREIV